MITTQSHTANNKSVVQEKLIALTLYGRNILNGFKLCLICLISGNFQIVFFNLFHKKKLHW